MGSSKTRAGNRQSRRDAKRNDHDGLIRAVKEEATKKPIKPATTPLKPLTDTQRLYDLSIRSNIVTFGTGPAGTGKTFFAARRAAQELLEGNIKKIIITRPAVEAGESLGFLPGDIDDKFEPYLRPVRDALELTFGTGHLEYLLKTGAIEARPLAYLRGASFSDAWILLDEAQNTSPVQMKMFLTRISKNCKVIVNGDTNQKDIAGQSGLADALRRLQNVDKIGHIHFATADIVRSAICKAIVLAYNDDDGEAVEVDEGGRLVLDI